MILEMKGISHLHKLIKGKKPLALLMNKEDSLLYRIIRIKEIINKINVIIIIR